MVIRINWIIIIIPKPISVRWRNGNNEIRSTIIIMMLLLWTMAMIMPLSIIISGRGEQAQGSREDEEVSKHREAGKMKKWASTGKQGRWRSEQAQGSREDILKQSIEVKIGLMYQYLLLFLVLSTLPLQSKFQRAAHSRALFWDFHLGHCIPNLADI